MQAPVENLTTAAHLPAADVSPLFRASCRFDSVDALRGLVMFTMLFVNDVAGVPGVPWWMQHWHPPDGNGMTFVDWVFGGFLFIVGVSIPLAFANRLARGESISRLIGHVALRAASLLLLGFFMVNGESGPDTARIGWPPHLWQMLVFACGILAFLPARRQWVIGLRALGFAGFVFLAIVYRDKAGGMVRPHWWGILGLIGWAYLVAAIGYLLLHKREWLATATFLLIGLFMFDHTGFFDKKWAVAHVPWIHWLHDYIDFGEMLGSQAAITMAGVVLGSMLLDPNLTHKQRLRDAMMWGFLLGSAALLFYPFYGINKNNATPAWCFICAAVTGWLWVIVSLLIDTNHGGPIGRFFVRGGQNVLLAYLLMPLWIHFMLLVGLKFYGKIAAIAPLVGIGRSLFMATLVLWLAGWLKDRGMRLRL